ncbi:PAS domain S-box protein [Leptospira wolffii]|uniref:SpoIIE family protein phosphatase n=1 Tax=Leptospira wolffii TaxID=409998 RepID=UPI00034BD9CB|nr:SpoIIE family protein phosphatase [Leptospira wolffii]TGK56997.1 PAS domain S-box protein [Leptospira wolffii]TGK71030.1 PAS domain S-box protein [Leptospira wolffii]TGK75721.1 PAS domain S-box protein [Leptospira wolffii]TGL32769.1 PAS domain S-box protein [Leptospira wolffii]
MSESDKHSSGIQSAFRSASRKDVIRILERITDAFLSLDRDLTIQYANFEAEKLLEVIRENLVGKRLPEILPQFNGSVLFPFLVDSIRSGLPKDMEILDEKNRIWYEVRIFPSSEDIAVYLRDVTTRKEGEVRLKESEERLSELVRTSLDPILSLNESLELSLVNPAAERLLGYDFWELKGKSVLSLIPERHRKFVSSVLVRLAKEPERGVFGPFKVKRKNGSEPIMEAAVSRVSTSSGIGYTLIFRDITDRILTQRKLRGTIDELKQVDRERMDLLQNLEAEVETRSAELSRSYRAMKEELSLAKRVQNSLLPPIDYSLAGVQTYVTYLPVMEVGGDWYDIFECKPGVLRILLADATGHGVQAALVTMTIKGVYEPLKYLADSPSELLQGINTDYCRNFKNLQMYFSCFILDVDTIEKKIRFASAGHPALLWKSGKQIRFLERTGSLVGLLAKMEFTEEEYSYEPGDSILMLTDGIFEEFDSEQNPFGEERIEKIYYHSDLEGFDLHRKIVYEMDKHMGGKSPQDDITLISVMLR